MKKVLLFSAIALSSFFSAQVLESDNFDAYPVGNVSTDNTGGTPGVGSYYTYSASGTVADFQIASIDVSHVNSLKLTGASAATGTKYVWKDDGATSVNYSWPTRTTGNDFLVGSLEIYTGSATGGAAAARSYIFNYPSSTTSQVLVGVGYNYANQKIVGYAYGTASSGTGTYGFTLGTATYPANTWVKVGYSFDYNTGALTWTTPEGTFSPSSTFTPGSAGFDPQEHDFLSTVTTGNTVSHNSAFDNFSIQASSTSVLATKQAEIDGKVPVEVYPNPTSDYINIISDSEIKNVKVYDMVGKKVLNQSASKQIDVRNLSKGAYIITIETDKGTESLKFIKK